MHAQLNHFLKTSRFQFYHSFMGVQLVRRYTFIFNSEIPEVIETMLSLNDVLIVKVTHASDKTVPHCTLVAYHDLIPHPLLDQSRHSPRKDLPVVRMHLAIHFTSKIFHDIHHSNLLHI